MNQEVSYPTRSLRFLKSGHQAHESLPTETLGEEHSHIRLNIIIAGAGLGGLAAAVALARTGHSVRIFEQAPALAEV